MLSCIELTWLLAILDSSNNIRVFNKVIHNYIIRLEMPYNCDKMHLRNAHIVASI
jgi:hypothetical protein